MTTNEIIERIAKENHTTPEEVEKEMRRAIQTAMKSNDPRAKELWKQISPDGKEPSIERFLKFCVDRANEQGYR